MILLLPSFRSRAVVEGHGCGDGVDGQVDPAAKDVHVLVLDPHVPAPEREAAEPARHDAHLLQDLFLGLVVSGQRFLTRAGAQKTNVAPAALGRSEFA